MFQLTMRMAYLFPARLSPKTTPRCYLPRPAIPEVLANRDLQLALEELDPARQKERLTPCDLLVAMKRPNIGRRFDGACRRFLALEFLRLSDNKPGSFIEAIGQWQRAVGSNAELGSVADQSSGMNWMFIATNSSPNHAMSRPMNFSER